MDTPYSSTKYMLAWRVQSIPTEGEIGFFASGPGRSVQWLVEGEPSSWYCTLIHGTGSLGVCEGLHASSKYHCA